MHDSLWRINLTMSAAKGFGNLIAALVGFICGLIVAYVVDQTLNWPSAKMFGVVGAMVGLGLWRIASRR